MDQHQDFMNSPNSQTLHYNSGETMAAAMADMTVEDQVPFRQDIKENGVPPVQKVPGEGPMKGQWSPWKLTSNLKWG